jgi:CheY-like chemotaxis protein
LSVLVVDANPDSADSLCLLLDRWGHRPLAAYDQAVAWEVALNGRPDVVLLEVLLPGLDGWEWTRRVRAEPSLRQTLIIAVTVCGLPSDRKRSHAAGLDFHLLKPVDPELLRNILAEFAAERQGPEPQTRGGPQLAGVVG